MQGDDFGVMQPLAHVTARFPSLSITRIATRKPCQPQVGRKTPPWHSPRGATGTRPRCCPLSASRRPGWQGGTRRGAHGGSPGAGRCESRAPGCRRWLVPPSSVPSPSPAAAASPAHCPQPPREASAHHLGTDPETRQRVHAGRAGQLLPGPPPPPTASGRAKMSFPPCRGLIEPLVSIPLPMTACPVGSGVTAGDGGSWQAGDFGAVPPPGGGSSPLHFTVQQHKMPQTRFLEKGGGI